MLKYIIKRISLGLITLLIVSIIIFSLIHFIPGDPIVSMYGEYLSMEKIESIRASYGLDKPIIIQYINWINKFVHLDFGESIVRGDDILSTVTKTFPRTFLLALTSIIIGMLVGFPMGIISALKRGTAIDVIISQISIFLISIPGFWFGLLFIIIFAVSLGIMPAGSYNIVSETGWDLVKYYILPSIVVGLIVSGNISRVVRAEMIENLDKEYINLVRSKGASEIRIIFFHVFRNALVATSTIIGMIFASLIGGVLTVEIVFGFPGLGRTLINAVNSRDYPTIQILVMVFSTLYIIINMFVDILYSILDPRIKFE